MLIFILILVESSELDQLTVILYFILQICVWCWNRLVEEAEKDEVLCPACRNPYDKEKIKGMTVGSDRHVYLLVRYIV